MGAFCVQIQNNFSVLKEYAVFGKSFEEGLDDPQCDESDQPAFRGEKNLFLVVWKFTEL
jgi:hypothetical protein